MKEEILAGIKVAIENGSSSDSAKQSFINAGYNPQEVNAAAEMLASGISDILYPSDEHNPRRLVSIIAASRHMADFLSFDLNDAIAFYDHAKNTGAKDKDQALAILRETFTDPDKMAKRYGTFYAERKDEIFAEMLIVTNGAES